MKSKKEMLKQFVNGELTRQQLKGEMDKTIPLIFEVPVSDCHADPDADAVGFYEQNGKRYELTYTQYKELARSRDVAICIHNPFEGDIIPNI